MSGSYYSSSWYRAAKLKPRIRSHAKFIRQQFRGETWHVIQDPLSGRFHRFSPAAHLILSMMDGNKNVQEIWDEASIQLGDSLITQDEMLKLLAQLHTADLLQMDELPDIEEVTRRGSQLERRKTLMSFLNPLAVRFPLLDPDRFLSATLIFARPFLSWFGAILYIAVVGTAIVLASVNWDALGSNLTDRVLAAESLFILALTYPFVKAIHELGHGYVIKKAGGEVHELGLMFLVFIPVPYVEASATTAFRSKWQRALVGAAGILVESFLAAMALFVWLNVEPGLVRAFAFNVMLIGGVSTVLFNGNPLLRFDGYYVFSDIIEIPNLGQRSNQYFWFLVQRYLFGIKDNSNPATAQSERKWLVSYAIAAFIYRIFIMSAIILFVATKFFIVGIILAVWGVMLMLGMPLFKGLRYLFNSPALRIHRLRAFTACIVFLAILILPLFFVPVPHRTIAEGVVMPPDNAAVYVGANGSLQELVARENQWIKKGTVIAKLADPFIASRLKIIEAEVAEFQLRYDAAQVVDRIEAKVHKERLVRAQKEQSQLLARAADLIVRSPRDGFFILPRSVDMQDRYLTKGSLLGFVIDRKVSSIVTVVPEEHADLVRSDLRGVELRFVRAQKIAYPARIVREVPSVSSELPSLALSTKGGGSLVLDPTAPDQARALEEYMQFELSPVKRLELTDLGGRVYVRFEHAPQALAVRLYRGLRQLLLDRFNV